jgi:hypothetical protein
MVDRRNEEDYLRMNDNLATMNASMKKPTPPQARIVSTQKSKDSSRKKKNSNGSNDDKSGKPNPNLDLQNSKGVERNAKKHQPAKKKPEDQRIPKMPSESNNRRKTTVSTIIDESDGKENEDTTYKVSVVVRRRPHRRIGSSCQVLLARQQRVFRRECKARAISMDAAILGSRIFMNRVGLKNQSGWHTN